MKKLKRFLFAAIFLLPSFMAMVGGIYAQQLPFSSQYYTDPLVINPAFTGTGEYTNAYLTHRSQWTGLEGAPQTSFLTVDGPLKQKDMGLGLKVFTDVTDILSRVGAMANYSYKYTINDSSHVLFGLAMGVLGNKIDFSKAIIKDSNDPFIFQQSRSKTVFTADLGVAYIWKRLTVGFAVPQLFGNRVKYPLFNDNNSYYNFSRHYDGTIKYEFDIDKARGITAFPLVMLRYVKGAPFQYDINGVVDWKNKGWVGLTYHSTYAFAISAGARYKNFSVGYAFDIGVSKIRSYIGSTSEFLLGYTFTERNKYKDLEKLEEQGRDTLYIAKRDTLQNILIVQMKALADSNKAQMDRLKAELEKAKTTAATTPANSTDAFITARLVDEQNNPLPDAQAEVVDKATNKVVARSTTAPDGTIRVGVPPGQNYDVVFNKTGYLYKPANIAVPGAAGSVAALNDVTMQKLEVGKKVVLNNILFDLNKSTLKPESYTELDHTVKLIQDIPSLEMEISGHTDNIGSDAINKDLSEQRAKAVMDYLVSKGCASNRLSFKGYGASQPIADNNTEDGRKINRRTEFKVLKVDGQYEVVSGGATTTGTATVAATQTNTAATPTAANPQYDAAIAQLKAKNDGYEQQIELLNTELAKMKIASATSTPTTTSTVDGAQLEKLQVKADTNQSQIEQLKWELTKVKLATMTNNANAGNDVEIARLKTKADSNRIEIDYLKSELAKTKIAAAATPVNANPQNDAEIAQLKSKSDTYQSEIDKLKAEIEKLKNAPVPVAATNNNDAAALAAKEQELAALKAKSDADQAEINRLKAQQQQEQQNGLDKLNSIINGTNTTATNTTGNTTTTTPADNTVAATPAATKPTPGVRTYKIADFNDDKGKPVGGGYYVVIGTFGSKENADKFKAASIVKGHATTRIVQNQLTKMYNVVVVKTNNREDAVTERAKYKAEYPDLWILNLE